MAANDDTLDVWLMAGVQVRTPGLFHPSEVD
jgi:hypothetical protein